MRIKLTKKDKTIVFNREYLSNGHWMIHRHLITSITGLPEEAQSPWHTGQPWTTVAGLDVDNAIKHQLASVNQAEQLPVIITPFGYIAPILRSRVCLCGHDLLHIDDSYIYLTDGREFMCKGPGKTLTTWSDAGQMLIMIMPLTEMEDVAAQLKEIARTL